MRYSPKLYSIGNSINFSKKIKPTIRWIKTIKLFVGWKTCNNGFFDFDLLSCFLWAILCDRSLIILKWMLVSYLNLSEGNLFFRLLMNCLVNFDIVNYFMALFYLGKLVDYSNDFLFSFSFSTISSDKLLSRDSSFSKEFLFFSWICKSLASISWNKFLLFSYPFYASSKLSYGLIKMI